jgi:thiol-disulfide isomerase/thioredoxin
VTRRARIAVTIGVLASLQILAVVVFRAVQRSRAPEAGTSFEAEPLAVAEPAPAMIARRIDGSEVSIAWPSPRMRIVHFWATWCEPCRDELPGLLAFARDMRDRGLDVVAVAVDDEWRAIHAFFDGSVPPEIVMAVDATAHRRFGVSTLPDSYLVDRAGKLIERYHGARDWQAPAARDHLLTLVR